MNIRKSTTVAAIGLMVLGSASMFGGWRETKAPQEQEKKELKKVPMEYTRPDSGSEMFSSYCAVCHGKTGKGDGPAVEFLKVPPPDLTTMTKRNNGKFPEDRVDGTLRFGASSRAHGTPDMPLWGQLFKSQNKAVGELRIHNLTKYVESIQEK